MPDTSTTVGWPYFRRPPFEPRAAFVAARELTWGSDEDGYVKIPMLTPLNLNELRPPCSEDMAAKLYRTGFFGMVLNEDGSPHLKTAIVASSAGPETVVTEQIAGSTCEKCGKTFKTRTVPYLHIKHCR